MIFVQESDVEKAIGCLQSHLVRGVHGLIEAKGDEDLAEECRRFSSEHHLQSMISQVNECGEQYLSIFPGVLVMLRLNKAMLKQSAYALTEMILFSKAALAPQSEDSLPEQQQRACHYFWCFCESEEELSLIVDEVRRGIIIRSLYLYDTNVIIMLALECVGKFSRRSDGCIARTMERN